MNKAYIIKHKENKYISYGETMDQAIEALAFGFSDITSQYLPELNGLEIIKVNQKTIKVKFKGKEHSLFPYKDSSSGNICSSATCKLDNGKTWYSYASEIQNALEEFCKRNNPSDWYTVAQELSNALYRGIKATKGSL